MQDQDKPYRPRTAEGVVLPSSAQVVTLAAVFSKMTAEDIVLAVVGNFITRQVQKTYVGNESPEEVMELTGQLLQAVQTVKAK